MRAELIPLEQSIAAAVIGDGIKTCRGFGILVDGELMGVAGLYLEHSRWIAFSDITPAAREVRHTHVGRRAAVLAIRRFKGLLARVRGPVHAVPDDTLTGSADILMRLGFRHLDKGVYEWRA